MWTEADLTEYLVHCKINPKGLRMRRYFIFYGRPKVVLENRFAVTDRLGQSMVSRPG